MLLCIGICYSYFYWCQWSGKLLHFQTIAHNWTSCPLIQFLGLCLYPPSRLASLIRTSVQIASNNHHRPADASNLSLCVHRGWLNFSKYTKNFEGTLDPLSPSRKVRECLADVISIHSSELDPTTAPVSVIFIHIHRCCYVLRVELIGHHLMHTNNIC